MPEGDTIFRAANVLRRALLGEPVLAARGRPGGPQLTRVTGSRVEGVSSRGKHLLISFGVGLTLHTHLGLKGAWHRYRPGEPWRRSATAAVAVLETGRSVAVCFDAPVVELLDSRALRLHPALAGLGPDLLAEPPDLEAAIARLRAIPRANRSIAEALLDQSAVAGIGNVYRSEVLYIEGIDPFARPGDLPDGAVRRVLATSARVLRANTGGGRRVTVPDALEAPPGASTGSRARTGLWVYGRAGQPCWRCGALILTRSLGQPPRRLWWCPRCQPRASAADVPPANR